MRPPQCMSSMPAHLVSILDTNTSRRASTRRSYNTKAERKLYTFALAELTCLFSGGLPYSSTCYTNAIRTIVCHESLLLFTTVSLSIHKGDFRMTVVIKKHYNF